MELTPRKRAVLKAIVKTYIETGEPVGSKSLALILENAPSSATLRNEMSDLCNMGLLCQPHTSAGRVPTSEGYKLYISGLSSDAQSSTDSQFVINELSKARTAPENIPAVAATMISRFTGLPAIACIITEKPSRIKRVELMPIGKFSVMLLVITDDGRTRNRVFRQGGDFSDDAKSLFAKIVENEICGKEVSLLTKAYMQSLIAGAGTFALELLPLFSAVFETAAEIENSDVVLAGENALYNMCRDEHTARKIVSLINAKEPIISVLQKSDAQSGVVFGADTGFDEFKDDTIVSAKFTAADKFNGYIAVLGPNRMSYEQIIPFVKNTAAVLTNIMTEAQNDMED